MRAGVAQGGIISPVLFILCKRHAFAFPWRRVGCVRGRHGRHSHVPSASAARQISGDIPYLSDLERWLRMAINVSNNSAMLFVKNGRAPRNPNQFTPSGSQSNGSMTPANKSYVGLRVSRLEVRRSIPCHETAGAIVQVSSHCY
jgi:hypothetical protein